LWKDTIFFNERRNEDGGNRSDSKEGKHKAMETDAGGKRKDYEGAGGGQAGALMGKYSTLAIHCDSR
jgi:hypothetical protein